MKAYYLGFCLVLASICLGQIVEKSKRVSFLEADPLMQYHAVVSLVSDGDLDVRNQFGFDPRAVADQSALGARGEWYPVHELPLVFLGVPFYLLFGTTGLFILNLVLALLLGGMMLSLSRQHAQDWLAFSASAMAFWFSPLPDLSYSFSVDVLGAAGAVLTVLLLTRRRFGWAGFALGMAIWSRIANAALLPVALGYCLLAPAWPRFRLREVFQFILCSVPPLLGMLLLNWHMFGSPLATGYHCNQYWIDGALHLKSQSHLWRLELIWEGLKQICFDPRLGILYTAPPFFPGLLLGSWRFARIARSDFWLCLGTIVSTVFFYAPYSGAIDLGGGPRHFLAIFALSAPFLALGLGSVFDRVRTKRI